MHPSSVVQGHLGAFGRRRRGRRRGRGGGDGRRRTDGGGKRRGERPEQRHQSSFRGTSQRFDLHVKPSQVRIQANDVVGANRAGPIHATVVHRQRRGPSGPKKCTTVAWKALTRGGP